MDGRQTGGNYHRCMYVILIATEWQFLGYMAPKPGHTRILCEGMWMCFYRHEESVYICEQLSPHYPCNMIMKASLSRLLA